MSSGIWQSRSTVLYCRWRFLVGADVQNSLWNLSMSLHSPCAALFSHEWMSSVCNSPGAAIGSWLEIMHYSCFFFLLFFPNWVYLYMYVCARWFCKPYFYRCIKLLSGVYLLAFVAFVLEPLPFFLHSQMCTASSQHFPAQAFNVLVLLCIRHL